MESDKTPCVPWDNYKDQAIVNSFDLQSLAVAVSLLLYPLPVTTGRQTGLQITLSLCWACVCVFTLTRTS